MRAPKAFDPRRLDVAAFAKAQARLDGRQPVRDFARLAELVLQDPAAEVAWTVEGRWHQPTGGEPERRLHLRAQAPVRMSCQRCLEPADLVLVVDRTLRFVRDEREAELLDEASEDEDVLALPPRLDVVELLEDELILALPLVPRHESCPSPLPLASGETADVDEADDAGTLEAEGDESSRPHPFAALAALKRGNKAN